MSRQSVLLNKRGIGTSKYVVSIDSMSIFFISGRALRSFTSIIPQNVAQNTDEAKKSKSNYPKTELQTTESESNDPIYVMFVEDILHDFIPSIEVLLLTKYS